MAKKSTPKNIRGSASRPDRYSNKKDGFFRQSVRLNKEDNDLIRRAAEAERMSINMFLTRAALAAARQVIATTTTK